MAPPSVHTWTPGLAVAQYVLVKEIARGGMGEIWLARQTGVAGFDRLVVLKRVIPGGGADAAAMTMFLDEARIASQLNHPNIVQVFELRQEASSVFLVMEFLAGQTASRFARRMIERSGQVPAALAVSVVASAAKALGYAHRRADLEGKPLCIVHRDVSPQNVFLTYDGEVKVLDFGIALATGRLARTAIGFIKGKVAYMSPEQAGGGGAEVTGAADVYALGIILFELVTGTRFYGKSDDVGVLRRLAAYAPPPRPSSRAPVEPELEELVLRALEPEPANRFADGQVFYEALEGWRRRHPPGADEPDLKQAMHELFEAEVAALGEFYRDAARTPVGVRAVARPLATVPRAELPTAAAAPTRPSAPPPAAPTRPSAPPPAAKKVPVAPAPSSASSMVTLQSVSRAAGRRSPGPLVAAAVAVVLVAGAALWWFNRSPEVAAPREALTVAPVDAGQPAEAVADAGVELATAPEVDVPPPPPAPLPKRATGLLTLGTQPYTRVFVGNRLLGDTPLVEVPLAAGQHRLRLINETEHVDAVIEVTIKAGQKTVKKIAF